MRNNRLIPNFLLPVGTLLNVFKQKSSKVAKNWHLHFFVIISSLFFLFFFLSHEVRADNFESERYRIQYGTINIGGENAASSGGYNLSVSLGQTAAGEFQSNGYVVKAGFQYLHSIIPFRFTISSTNMDFGTLIPQLPTTQETSLTVSFGSAGSYQVSAQEESPLKTLAGTFIPDTVCDNSTDPCNENSAEVWKKNNAYGFGYNISGNDVPPDFADTNYFLKGFPLNFFGKVIRIFDSSDKIPVVLEVENQGRNVIKPEGEITLKGNFGEKATYSILPQNILSGSKRIMTATPSAEIPESIRQPVSLVLSGFFMGKYSLSSEISFGEGSPNIFAQTSFLALPIKFLIGLFIAMLVAVYLIQKFRK